MCIRDSVDTVRVSVSTSLPVYDSFSIQRDVGVELSVEPQSVVYSSPLPVKKAKYKDVMHLATNFVPPNEIGFYKGLKCKLSDGENHSVDTGTDDDDQANEL